VEVHKPGASITMLFKNGSSLSQRKENGLVRHIRNADGSECQYQVTEEGQLRPLHHKYAGPTRVEFFTAEGIQIVEDICEVHFDWLESNGIVKMTYRSSGGSTYLLERDRHGQFLSFSRGS